MTTDSAPRMTYPKWMNDALASDLNAVIEAREAEARAEYERADRVVRNYLAAVGYLESNKGPLA